MKMVFKSSEICHIWAHQSAPQGRSPSALSFDGPLLMSYNTGIARQIEHKGRKAVIVNNRSFSITTSDHQGNMRRALPDDRQRFYVSEERGARLNFTGSQLYAFAIGEATVAATEAAKAKRQSSREKAQARQGYWLNESKRVNEFFHLRRKVDEKAIQRLAAVKAKAGLKAEKLRKEREAKQQVEYMAEFEAWKAGTDGGYFPHCDFPIAFRVEDGELVSTMGARVPLQDAKRAYRFATSKRGQAWRQNGETCPVGNYALSAINDQGIVAGCHRITWAEVERLAPMLA